MIAVVVYGREECVVAKRGSHDLVVFMEQSGVAAVYPLSRSVEEMLTRLKLCAFERHPHGSFQRHRFPYDPPEFVFPLDEVTFTDLLREFVPHIEIRNWRKPTRGQLPLRLCFECRENCRACATKIR